MNTFICITVYILAVISSIAISAFLFYLLDQKNKAIWRVYSNLGKIKNKTVINKDPS